MTRRPLPMLPGSRTLLGWWRELASLQPRRLWFGQALFHRVEALVGVATPRRLDPLEQALLRAASAADEADPLAPLHLDRQVATRLLGELEREGLLRAAGGRRELTDPGREALGQGFFLRHDRERRAFYFLDNTPAGRPPHYLPLHRPRHVTTPHVEGVYFDPALLESCVRQPPEWKARFRFPPEVEAVFRVAEGEQDPDWRRVVVERAEQMTLAFAEVAGEEGRPTLLGFAVREEGWVLEHDEPVLALPEGWEEALPELAGGPGPEAWQRAWQAWCQPRSLPAGEVEACRLEPSGHQLLVRAPQRLVERLRAARSDAVKGEAWVLAGGERFWEAAQVELAGV